MKRYQVTVQHQVIIYAEDEGAAKAKVLSNPEMKLRHNLQCVSAEEIPMPEKEERTAIVDERKAPGS